MKQFQKHTEIPTVCDGVYLKIEATPKDARDNDVANNFYIGYLIDRRPLYIPSANTATYSANLRTFSAEELRALLDIKPKERTYWD